MAGKQRRTSSAVRSLSSRHGALLIVMGYLVVLLFPRMAGALDGGHVRSPQRPTATETITNQSYAIVDDAGGVATYGGAAFSGDLLDLSLSQPVVAAVPDPSGGYWMATASGSVFAFGLAPFFGASVGKPASAPVVGMATTPKGNGYWLVRADGQVSGFGDARPYGSVPASAPSSSIVGMAATPTGGGYWLVASDGSVFAFGDAAPFGSLPGTEISAPVVAILATRDGMGYLLVTSDGNVLAFGDAPRYGSMIGQPTAGPITSIASTPDGRGYWLVSSQSGVYAFGDAEYGGGGTTTMLPYDYPHPWSLPFHAAVQILPLPAGPETTSSGPMRVGFVGDSLSSIEAAFTQDVDPPFSVRDTGTMGCGTNSGSAMEMYATPTEASLRLPACANWAQNYRWVAHYEHDDVIVMQAGFWDVQPAMFDGAFEGLGDPAYYSFMQGEVGQAVQLLHQGGAAVILCTAPFYGDGTPNWAVDEYNDIVRHIAQEDASFVKVLDVNRLISPGGYRLTLGGLTVRTAEGIHLTEEGVQQVLDPVLVPTAYRIGAEAYGVRTGVRTRRSQAQSASLEPSPGVSRNHPEGE